MHQTPNHIEGKQQNPQIQKYHTIRILQTKHTKPIEIELNKTYQYAELKILNYPAFQLSRFNKVK